MAQVIGTVEKLVGTAFARAADGTQRELRLGDELYVGETLLTGPGAVIEVAVPDAPSIVLPADRELRLTGELLAETRDSADEAAVQDPTIAAVVSALEGDGDILENLQATAAGGAQTDEGSSFVRLGRIAFELPEFATLRVGATAEAPTFIEGEGDNDLQLLLSGQPGVDPGDGGSTPGTDPGPTPPLPSPPANEAPLATDDSFAGDFATALQGNVLSNDTDPENDSLTVTDNTTPANGTLSLNPDGTFTYTPNDGFSGQDSFTYTVSDGSGNSDTATVTITVAGEPGEPAPPPPIVNDPPVTVDDSVETGFESSVTVPVLGNDSDPDGDPLQISASTQPSNGSVIVNADGTITYTPNAGFSGSDSFEYTVSDGRGNESTATVTVTVDAEPTEPTSPSATITLDGNITADDVIDATEAGQSIPITGSTGGDVAPGDTVTLTVNGNDYTGQVDAGGNFSIEVPGSDLVADGDLTIDASVTTSTGNPNGEATATDTEGYSVNTTSPSATITLDANVTADDIIDAAEQSQQIAITGSTGGDVAEGDTVTLTVNGNTYTGPVDASGNFSIDVPGSDLVADGDLTIDASVTTNTGNPNGEATATDTEGYSVNIGSPSASITLDANITADDVISAAEQNQQIAITGSTGGDVAEGDTVTLTVNGNTYTGAVDASGNFSIDVPGSDLVADGDLTIDASVTTNTGNPNGEATVTDTEGYSVNTTSPSATITLDANVTADDIIDATEAGQNIAITGSTGGDVAPGDTVTLTVNGNTYTGPVDASGNFSIDVPGSDLVADGDLTIDASVTTSTGNPNGEATATDTEGYSVNTGSPSASINLDANITADDVIDATEQNQQIAITGSTGGDVVEGDTVTLTVNGNTYTGPVDASGNFSIEVPGADLVADGDLTIDASVTTNTGNPNGEATATATEGYSVNTTSPSATITLDGNITADDIIDAAEQSQQIAITGSTGGDVAEGDTVTLTVNGNTYTGPVDASGNFSVEVPGSDLVADGDLTIDASVTTSTGSPNGEATATDTEGYSVNTTSPSASITLDANITADDVIDATETGQSVAITGSTGGDVAPGDTVTLTVNGNDYTGQVDASGNFSIEVPGADLVADGDLTIDASVTTSTGNPNGEATATATEGYSVNTTSPSATITLDSNITADDVIDATEQSQQIAITGSTGGDVAEGDTVTLTVNGNDYTGQVDTSGNFSIEVPGSDLVADGDLTVDASVTTSTGSPNGEATATDTEGYSVNTGSPSATLTLDPNITPDDVISAAEQNQQIAITGSTGGDVADGDTVTLTVNGNTYTGPVDASGNFSIEVPGSDLVADGDLTIDASVTTSTGSPNGEATATDTEGYSVNTTSPSATITLDANITADDVISAAEQNQQIPITGSTGGDVAEGDTVTVTVNGNEYTGPVDASGNFSIDVPGTDLVADGDLTIDASVTTSTGSPNDEATATDTEGYSVNTGSPSASITLDPNITADDVISAAEQNQQIAITGSTGGDVAENDTVTLTVNGSTYTGPVDASGNFSIEVPGADLVADGDLTIDASVTTSTGNPNGEATATDTEGYSVNTGSPSASITLDANITADDVISAAEQNQQIPITGSTGGDVAENDTVTLTVNGSTYTGPVDATGNFSIEVPGSDLVADGDLTIDASVTTSTGNPNGEATATDTEGYSVNTTSPSATITLDANITADDVISAAEQNQQIPITGSTGGDVAEGDTVTVTVNGNEYTGPVDASGNFSIEVPGADLVADGDLTIDASVTTSTDNPNGEATATDTEGYMVSTPPQADPVLTTAEFATGPGPSGTLSNPQLAVQFGVNGILDGNGAESSPTLGGLDTETDLAGLTFTLRSLPTNGSLYLDANGDGTYAQAQVGDTFNSGSGLYWGTTATQVTQDLSRDASGVSVSGYNDGAASTRQTGSGLGVASADNIQNQAPDQLGYRDGSSESMTLNFGGPVTDATVRIERLFVNEGEAGRVEALDENGNAIGSWTFFGAANRTLGGQPIDFNIGGNGGSFTISDTSEPFYALRFTATPYVDGVTQGPGNADSSDYFIKSVAYTRISLQGAEFTYDVTDADGNVSAPATVVIEPPVLDPIALDLDNDGVEYLSREAGVVFTDEETGESSNTAWVAGDDGLLVIDADNSGTVNTTREYVFTEWSDTAETDMEAVREVFDSNDNDMLDPGDEAWEQFAVWQDADSDGVTDPGELRSLTELGVESIALTYSDDSSSGTAADGDVMIYGQSEVTWADGEVTVAEDTGFAIDPADVLTGGDDLVLPAGEDSATDAGQSVLTSQRLASQPAESNAAELAALEIDLLLNTGNDDKLNEGGAAE